MPQNYKIHTYLDQIIDAYKEPIQRVDGLTRDPKDIIRTVEFYSHSQYLSGNVDELGREKPFYNVGNYRVTVAKVATDLDVKDLKYEPDSLKFSVQAMIINHELFKYLKESKFSLTLNEMGVTRPKYGGVLVKKYEYEGKLDINVIEWTNIDFDPADIIGGALIETYYMQPSEFMGKMDVWENVSEVMKEFAKANKGKPGKIMVKAVHGEFPMSFYKECAQINYKEKEADTEAYKRMCFYVAVIGKKKYNLYYELDKEVKFKYLPWEAVGLSLGRGVWEDGFQSQVATNDAVISGKNAVNLTGKVLLYTDSQKVSGNAITGMDNGHILELEQGKSITALNLGPSKLPEIEKLVEMWDTQYSKSASTYDANTGEAPTAGTPYSQTALLNQVANSPFEYRREEWGIFLNEIMNDWILPHLKKTILKDHYLTSEFDDDELNLIDEAITTFESNQKIKENMLGPADMNSQDQAMMIETMKQGLKKSGNKREIKIPAGFLDVEGKITANITGELKNKSAILQSLDSIFKTVVSTFNPQTGQYAALQDPALAKIFAQIVELSGVPFSSGSLRPGKSAPTPTPQAPTGAPTLSNITPTNGNPTPAAQ